MVLVIGESLFSSRNFKSSKVTLRQANLWLGGAGAVFSSAIPAPSALDLS
jgi:hypothetical protein